MSFAHWRGLRVRCADVEALDHVQMTALTRALKVNIKVAYLDGHVHAQEGNVSFVDFTNVEESAIDPVILLYRYASLTLFILWRRSTHRLQTWTLRRPRPKKRRTPRPGAVVENQLCLKTED